MTDRETPITPEDPDVPDAPPPAGEAVLAGELGQLLGGQRCHLE